MEMEILVQLLLGLVGVLLTVIGFSVTYILYGMKEEMKSTRVELTGLVTSVSSVISTIQWHQKWLERHDDEIAIIRNNN